ncbi:MAG: DUF6288 domain-containing protein [Planctomycetota bacterium]|nr:DUF6288 domain-containing protein [Planctomycetota bacterium]
MSTHPCRPLLLSTLAALAAVAVAPAAEAQRDKPPVPDLTAGDQPDDKHDWNLGPTGARGWMWGWKLETAEARQVLITRVAAGSPADGILEPGDVLLGLGSTPFEGDPRRLLGDAITAAEAADGGLELLRWRKGEAEAVTVPLPRLGAYAESAPFRCPKSAAILDAACAHMASHMKGDIDGMVNALALLATGEPKYRDAVRDLARQVGDPSTDLSLEGRTSGLFAWQWGYRLLFLTEYYLATKDRKVMPAIVEYATTIAQGQSGVGTWGHGMAWPDLNDGRLHGKLGGYGALNQAGLICHLGLVLAERCGVRDQEVRDAIVRANRFAVFYVGKGAIPYGDHRPGWDVHDDNGKDGVAALIFDLQGMSEEARFFARMTTASYGERERGHTGNYFSYLWGPVGVMRAGPEAVSAFLAEQRWYYDLARAHDGSFPYQGGAGMSGGEHKYGSWDCTGAFVLSHTFDRGELFLTGKGASEALILDGRELRETIAAGRGFDNWSLAKEHYAAKDPRELLELLQSWSPAVRSRAADALAAAAGDPLPELLRLLKRRDLESRYGACQALAALGSEAAEATPQLLRLLDEDDVWLRIQACYALAAIGERAREAAVPMLELALRDDPEDPRGFTQRYLAFCLFYPGGALKMRGLLSRSVEGIDRELLRRAILRLMQNDDGRARGAVAQVFKLMTLDELAPILPEILEAVRTPSPSGVMFSNGIRLAGLEFLAQHRIAEGMELCIAVTEIDQWGKQDRIVKCMQALQRYGSAAAEVRPQLEDLQRRLRAHKESKNLGKQLALVAETLAALDSGPLGPPVRTVEEVVRATRRGR